MLLIPLGSHFVFSQVDVFWLHNFKTMSVYLIDLFNKVMVLSVKKTLERGLPKSACTYFGLEFLIRNF